MGLWKSLITRLRRLTAPNRADTVPDSTSVSPIPCPPAQESGQQSGRFRGDGRLSAVDGRTPFQRLSRDVNLPAEAESVPVTIGFDFGTHSTKVLVRPRGSNTARLVQIEPPTAGYPSFVAPSLVRIVDGAVVFGGSTLQIRTGTLYRSLKVQLLPPCTQDRLAQGYPKGPEPDLLVAAYLSWALEAVKETIQSEYSRGLAKVSLNMAAPMNHIEHPALKTRYLQVVQAAWESVFGPSRCPAYQGMPLDTLEARFLPLLGREVPPRQERMYEILPETLAPIVSLSLDPRMEPGMYMLVDMGAGTTELSVNHVNDPGADQIITCYYDESVPLFGGDNFAWAESLTNGNCAHEVRLLIERLKKIFLRTWFCGYQKDAPCLGARNKWRTLQVLLAGGAARRPDVMTAIEYSRPDPGYPVAQQTYSVAWHKPIGITLQQFPASPKTPKNKAHSNLRLRNRLALRKSAHLFSKEQ